MDRLEAMAILIAVVETGSFSGASRKLRVPLPTVSRKVSDLETHLKAQLLIRSTRKLTLTGAGADYIAASKRILEQVSDAESALAGEFIAARGELVVTAPIMFGRLHVLPAIHSFLKAFPDINIRLALSDRNVDLIDDHVDLAVRIGTLPDSSLMATRVGTVRRIVCGSPAYFAGHGKPEKLEDLSRHAAITFDMMGSAAVWDFALPGAKKTRSVPMRSRLAVNSAEAAVDAAIAGLGVTRVLSYQSAQAVKERRLETVLAQFEPTPIPVNLIHAGQSLQPLKMRAFLEFVVPRLRKRVAELER